MIIRHPATPGDKPAAPVERSTLRRAEFVHPPRPRSSWTGLLWLVVLAGVGAAAWFVVPKYFPLPWFSLQAKRIASPPAPVIPVVGATAHLGKLDMFIHGLGTVTAFNTVSIRSRVEGELVEVAFDEGQLVEEGKLLVRTDPRPYEARLAEAEGQLAKDQATLTNAQLDLERYRRLSKSITQQQIDTQAALVRQLEGMVKSDAALVESAKLELAYCKIFAPISGRIGFRSVDKGNIVRANEPTALAVITQLQPIAVMFTIPQDEITRVQRRINEGETLVVEAFDRDYRVLLARGELAAVDNQVDQSTGTIKLKAVFENEDNALFPNQFVNARLQIETLEDVVLIPTESIQRGPDSTFVYLTKADSTVEVRQITLGPSEAGQTVVTKGVAAGDVVITEGVDKLREGTKIKVRSLAKGKTEQTDLDELKQESSS